MKFILLPKETDERCISNILELNRCFSKISQRQSMNGPYSELRIFFLRVFLHRSFFSITTLIHISRNSSLLTSTEPVRSRLPCHLTMRALMYMQVMQALEPSALGQYLERERPRWRLCYTSSEPFRSNVIFSVIDA